MDNDNDRTESFVPLTKGTKVGHYTIVNKIGAGGMGEVYLAEDTKLKRQVALKFLPYQFISDENAKARFRREAQAAAKLNHPNIVHIYEVSEYQKRPFFAMECCDGKPLRDVIKEKELGIEETINLTIQICEGLEKAHQAGIVHRDIKPSNIVIDSDGRPKLLDFGLATVQGTEKLTQTGSTLGTIGYMSPEQINIKEIDHRSDLFSLGVVLYEMITGRLPFKAETDAGTLNSILNDTPEPLSRYKSNVPEQLQQIITKLLEKNSAYRYQSAAGVLSDLKRLSSKPVQTAKPIDKWNRYIVPSALVILLAILVIWKFGYQDQTSTEETTDRIMLAVLPFENLGLPEDEYFADGITDEITSRLSEVSDLGVISRTSAYAFKNSDLTIPEIAKVLDVHFVLEGTIRWHHSDSLDRVRIIPQLIDVQKDVHVWSSRYDRQVTDIFEIQAEIAKTVTTELGASLSSERRIAAPVVVPEAYQYYLMGMAHFNNRQYNSARNTFQQAINLDSNFSKAYAGLSEAISNYDFWSIRELLTANERRMALQVANRSLQLEPELVQGLRAMGTYYYLVEWEHYKALDYLNRALAVDPEDGATNFTVGSLYMHANEYEKAITHLERALKVDPTHENYAKKLARAFSFLRRYDEARSILRRALSFNPNSNELWANLAHTEFVETGSPEGLKKIIDEARGHVTDFYSSGSHLLIPDVYDMIQGDYTKVLNRIKKHGLAAYANGSEERINAAAYYAYLAIVCHYGGWKYKARSYADTASNILENRLSNLDAPDAPAGARLSWPLTDLAGAYAIMGQKNKAIALVNEVLSTEPLKLDGYQGPWAMSNLAIVLTLTGEYERAIDILDTLLQVPAPVSLPWIKVEPFLAPLRDHPRFHALTKKYEKKDGI